MKKIILPLTISLMAATAAIAQTTAPEATTPPAPAEKMEVTPPAATETAPAPSAEVAAPSSTGVVTLTDEQAKAWVDKPIYSSDDKNLGEVAAIARSSSGEISEIHADIGGFLGIGETRVRVMPAEFKLAQDKVVLNLTADQAKQLPKIAK